LDLKPSRRAGTSASAELLVLCGVRWRHNRAPNLEPRFWSISYQFEEGFSDANYASIWTPFSTSVAAPDVLCNAVNISQIPL